MPRVTLTPIAPIGPYPVLPVAANSLDLIMTAADIVNLNQFNMSGGGKFVILAQNTHATTAYTITLTSAPDSKRRSGDVTTYTLQATDIAAFLVDATEGWQQTDGYFYLQAENAAVKFCILRLPS